MTSRTTPVGILVIALVSLIAVGCSAPTNAVFQALLDPAGTAVSPSEADPAVDDAESGADPSWWPHPDGYAMVLPAGWSGVAVDRDGTDELVEAISSAMPDLGQRMSDVLDGSKARVSAFAVDPAALDGMAPMMIVLAEPTDGRRAHAIKTDVRERIYALPGRAGPLSAHDVALSAAKGVRFDYAIEDPDLGALRVFSYLFRFGRTAYLVNFVAPAEAAAEAEAVFDAIAGSLRFGV